MTSETNTYNSQYVVIGLENFLRGREKDRRRERSTLETCIWPNITCFDYEASQNSHILLLLQSSTSRSLHLFLVMAECSIHKQPTHFIVLLKQSSTRATGGAEKDVVYNWIGLLRNYTGLLLFTFLHTFILYSFLLKTLRNKLIHISMCVS